MANIALRDVSVRYPGAERAALTVPDLRLDGGRIVGLLGENGAGKSTLIHAIGGVRKPSTGTITVTADRVGWCAQQLMIDWFVSTRTNVWLGARLAGLTGQAAWDRADACLAMVDIDADLAARTPETLSGGQQQRLMIARVLAMNPDVMLLDEPTVGLDLGNIERLGTAMREAAARGALVLVSSHDFTALESLVDDVLLLHRGHVRYSGGVEAFVQRFVRSEEVAITLAEPLADGVRGDDLGEAGHASISDDRLHLTLVISTGQPLGAILECIESSGGAWRMSNVTVCNCLTPSWRPSTTRRWRGEHETQLVERLRHEREARMAWSGIELLATVGGFARAARQLPRAARGRNVRSPWRS